MAYTVVPQHGDSLAVPQVVLNHLAQADGDSVRVALYLLQTGESDPRTLAKVLGLPSMEAARRALQFWAGAGLLEPARGKNAPVAADPATPTPPLNLASLTDPYVTLLCEEAQKAFGKSLSRSELQKLVAFYINDGWQPDVILTCCNEVARQNRHTVAAVARELGRWREEGVETGEDAEQLLRRQKQREDWRQDTAKQFGVEEKSFSRWERSAITRWYEEWNVDGELVEEALLRAGSHTTVRYVDGILRSWRSQGITTASAARGQGQLSGSNITATQRLANAPAASTATGPDLFNRDWNAIFDEEG